MAKEDDKPSSKKLVKGYAKKRINEDSKPKDKKIVKVAAKTIDEDIVVEAPKPNDKKDMAADDDSGEVTFVKEVEIEEEDDKQDKVAKLGCKICPKVFSTEDELDDHNSSHKKKAKVKNESIGLKISTNFMKNSKIQKKNESPQTNPKDSGTNSDDMSDPKNEAEAEFVSDKSEENLESPQRTGSGLGQGKTPRKKAKQVGETKSKKQKQESESMVNKNTKKKLMDLWTQSEDNPPTPKTSSKKSTKNPKTKVAIKSPEALGKIRDKKGISDNIENKEEEAVKKVKTRNGIKNELVEPENYEKKRSKRKNEDEEHFDINEALDKLEEKKKKLYDFSDETEAIEFKLPRSRKKSWPCTPCGKPFLLKRDLMEHEQKNHTNKRNSTSRRKCA